MLFQFHELFSVIFWHKFCSLCMYHYDTRMAPTKELIAISIKEVETYNKLFRSIGDAIQSFFYHLVRQKSHSGKKIWKKVQFRETENCFSKFYGKVGVIFWLLFHLI